MYNHKRAYKCLLYRYIQAATSPKDVVILLDASGSMKGLRLEIAKATINKILDTLSDDDFFNVMKVSHYYIYLLKIKLHVCKQFFFQFATSTGQSHA